MGRGIELRVHEWTAWRIQSILPGTDSDIGENAAALSYAFDLQKLPKLEIWFARRRSWLFGWLVTKVFSFRKQSQAIMPPSECRFFHATDRGKTQMSLRLYDICWQVAPSASLSIRGRHDDRFIIEGGNPLAETLSIMTWFYQFATNLSKFPHWPPIYKGCFVVFIGWGVRADPASLRSSQRNYTEGAVTLPLPAPLSLSLISSLILACGANFSWKVLWWGRCDL